MELFEAIKNRRSVRKYDRERAVPDDIVDSLLDAARWAPSWANTQCIRTVVVRDSAMRKQIASELSDGNPALRAVEDAPVVVVFVAALETSGYYRGAPSDDKAWHLFDAGLFVQNFCLAAHAMGLGTVICGAMDYRAIEKLLRVPDGFQVVALTPLGYPTKESKAPPRKDVAELKFQETWGA